MAVNFSAGSGNSGKLIRISQNPDPLSWRNQLAGKWRLWFVRNGQGNFRANAVYWGGEHKRHQTPSLLTGEVKVRVMIPRLTMWILGVLSALSIVSHAAASEMAPPGQFLHQSIPVLGMTLDKTRQPVGIVTYVMLHFHQRSDHDGLKVHFRKIPGRFGPIARKAVATAIDRAARSANLQDDSWTVVLTFPYSGLTLYGDSLSAMVALSVLALAKNEAIVYGRTLTGRITEDGHIGKVAGIPYKIYAAYAERLDRVLIPEEQDPHDSDWRTPFLMHVSHVGTLEKAYQGLTGRSLFSRKSLK